MQACFGWMIVSANAVESATTPRLNTRANEIRTYSLHIIIPPQKISSRESNDTCLPPPPPFYFIATSFPLRQQRRDTTFEKSSGENDPVINAGMASLSE
jgi:hypothetical protein